MSPFDIRDVNTVQPEGLNVKQMNEDVFTCKHIYPLAQPKMPLVIC